MNAALEPEPTIEQQIAAARSRAYGLESALAERAVILLDKLSRSVVHPYVMYSETGAVLVQNTITDLPLEDFRNDQEGVFLITSARVTDSTTTLGTNVGEPFDNLSIQVFEDSHRPLMKHPALLSTVFPIVTNTARFERPYLLDRGRALQVQITEENTAATSLLYLAFLGEVLLGEMTKREVAEAIGLGIYPVTGRQSSIWDTHLFVRDLLGDRPPKLRGEIDDILLQLRARVADLQEKLRAAEPVWYGLEAGADNITASGVTRLPVEDLRNQQGGAFAVSQIQLAVDNFDGTAIGDFENNLIKLSIYSMAERIWITRPGTEVLSPCLVSRADGVWGFPHPHVMRQTSALEVQVREMEAGTPDVRLSAFGEVLRGMDATDLRAAICLGLYTLVNQRAS